MLSYQHPVPLRLPYHDPPVVLITFSLSLPCAQGGNGPLSHLSKVRYERTKSMVQEESGTYCVCEDQSMKFRRAIVQVKDANKQNR